MMVRRWSADKEGLTYFKLRNWAIDTISNFAVKTWNEIDPTQATVKIYQEVFQVEEETENQSQLEWVYNIL